MKTLKRPKLVIATMFGIILASLALAATPKSQNLFLFKSGEVIQASQINSNFELINRRTTTNNRALGLLAGITSSDIEKLLVIARQLSPQEIHQLSNVLLQVDNRLSTLEGSCISIVSSLVVLERETYAQGFRLDTIEEKTKYQYTEGTTTVFSGTNLQIQNGSGLTTETNSLGNLILGYNEENSFLSCYSAAPSRVGSHNLIVGPDNEWTGYGSLVVGNLNKMHGNYCVTVGCTSYLRGRCQLHFKLRLPNHQCSNGNHNGHDD